MEIKRTPRLIDSMRDVVMKNIVYVLLYYNVQYMKETVCQLTVCERIGVEGYFLTDWGT